MRDSEIRASHASWHERYKVSHLSEDSPEGCWNSCRIKEELLPRGLLVCHDFGHSRDLFFDPCKRWYFTRVTPIISPLPQPYQLRGPWCELIGPAYYPWTADYDDPRNPFLESNKDCRDSIIRRMRTQLIPKSMLLDWVKNRIEDKSEYVEMIKFLYPDEDICAPTPTS